MEIKTKSLQPRVNDAAAAEAQLKNVSELYEKQFLREMVKQMRTTVSESELMPASFGEKYYREQLDQQYVESWGDRGGIGLGKLIYDQLMERYGERLGIRVPKTEIRGPLPLNQRDNWTGDIQEKNHAICFERKALNDGKPATIESPWAGSWLGTFKLENGLQVAKIKHDGMQSMFVGDFQCGERQIGDPIKQGENIGVLSLDAKSFIWKVDE